MLTPHSPRELHRRAALHLPTSPFTLDPCSTSLHHGHCHFLSSTSKTTGFSASSSVHSRTESVITFRRPPTIRPQTVPPSRSTTSTNCPCRPNSKPRLPLPQHTCHTGRYRLNFPFSLRRITPSCSTRLSTKIACKAEEESRLRAVEPSCPISTPSPIYQQADCTLSTTEPLPPSPRPENLSLENPPHTTRCEPQARSLFPRAGLRAMCAGA